MTKPETPCLHDEIVARINLSRERVAAAACEGGIPEFAERLAEALDKFHGTYVTERIYEEASRLRAIYKADIEEAARMNGSPDVWEDLFPPRFGQTGHDSLRMLYDVLKEFWMQLRSELKQKTYEAQSDVRNQPFVRKNKAPKLGGPKAKKMLTWAPVFKKDYVGDDGREEKRPQNATGRLFLAVAQLFDPAYSSRNCYSVVERVKDEKRSPKGFAGKRERGRRAARKSRSKARSSEKGAY
jgi:hypothetical protein